MDCWQTSQIAILTLMHRYHLLQYHKFCRESLRVSISKIRFSVSLQNCEIIRMVLENAMKDFDQNFSGGYIHVCVLLCQFQDRSTSILSIQKKKNSPVNREISPRFAQWSTTQSDRFLNAKWSIIEGRLGCLMVAPWPNFKSSAFRWDQ
jgi:hypothetical protein